MPKGMDVGDWTVTIILAVVLMAVVAGTYGALLTQTNAFKNATGGNALATVLVTLTPILISAGILLVFVYGFLPSHGKHK